MIQLPEEGDTDETRDRLLSTWDTYCVVEYFQELGISVLDWSLRRGWARVEVDWSGSKMLDVVDGVSTAKHLCEIGDTKLVETIRGGCMEHWHSFDHIDFRGEATGLKVGTLFFKVPIDDDPKHPAFFQLPNKVARDRARKRRCEALEAHLREPMENPLDAFPDILMDKLEANRYRVLMEVATQVYRTENHLMAIASATRS
jgi:hypothetical protein